MQRQSASFQLVRQIALSDMNTRVLEMRKSYDFSKSVKNPYSRKLKKQINNRFWSIKMMANYQVHPYKTKKVIRRQNPDFPPIGRKALNKEIEKFLKAGGKIQRLTEVPRTFSQVDMDIGRDYAE